MDAPSCAHCADDADGEAQSLGATLADGGCSPFDDAARQELHERVEAALREVPEAFRTVVVLREIEGFTYEEIAEILQVNLGTVKSRLTRGRVALRELLAPERTGRPIAGKSAARACVSPPRDAKKEQSFAVSGNRHLDPAGSSIDSGSGSCLEALR